MSERIWPGVLQDIAQVAGDRAAELIATSYGGTRVRIPGRYRPGGWLDGLVGETAARAIISFFAVHDADGRPTGVELVVPAAGTGSLTRARRQADIAFARAIDEGCGVRTAARRAGFSEMSGWRKKRKLREPDLFSVLPGDEG